VVKQPYMPLDAKIYVAGHRGLVGSAIVRELERQGYSHVIGRTHRELDLTDAKAVSEFFKAERPDFVFMSAARVGGISANATYPVQFIRENLLIQNNVIDSAYENKAARLLFFGSSCIYPKFAPQPIPESSLLTGELEPTNRPYALAKIAGVELCWSYNRQYGTKFLSVMPTNLYGPGDNYDLQNSHVLPAMIRKIAEAMRTEAPAVNLWGTGTPRRELMYSEDLADGAVFLMNLDEATFDSMLSNDEAPLINLGTGEDVTILELAQVVAKVLGYEGKFAFDTTKPDGTPRKLLDVSRMHKLGWHHKTSLEEGIRITWENVRTTFDIQR
jgi:GDP-L-fucose synthase